MSHRKNVWDHFLSSGVGLGPRCRGVGGQYESHDHNAHLNDLVGGGPFELTQRQPCCGGSAPRATCQLLLNTSMAIHACFAPFKWIKTISIAMSLLTDLSHQCNISFITWTFVSILVSTKDISFVLFETNWCADHLISKLRYNCFLSASCSSLKTAGWPKSLTNICSIKHSWNLIW